ncbi:MAG TPA: bifunctional diguanylate cyclase/phosphodiesterase [Mycobacteriales bacterium]|nr:bifunctional diguanylate cyclase/phosphodiesterase [Mycobacteriales bacterium]
MSVTWVQTSSFTTRRPSLGRSAWAWYLSAGAVAITGYYSLGRASAGQAAVINAINFTSAICAALAAWRSRGTNRTVWIALAVAMLLSSSANVPYYAYPLATGRSLPFPSVVDLCWLGTYPCFGAALWALAQRRRKSDRLGDALDAAILAVSGAALTWQYLIAPIVRTSMPLPAHVVSVTYPAMDLMVFALLARFVVASGWRNGALGILTASFICLLFGDSVYTLQLAAGTYHFGGEPDALWMGSYLLIGVAALHPHARTVTDHRPVPGTRLSRERVVFLCAAVLTGPAILVLQPSVRIVASLTSAVCFLLVMARLADLNKQLAEAGAQLKRRATTDPLTGLRNRAAFYDQAARSIRNLDGLAAVLFIDLDDFKDVNDSLGHAAGDNLLSAVSARLESVIRPSDLIARLGGDEFAVLLTGLEGERAAIAVGERVVSALGAPVQLDTTTVQVAASVGLTFRSAPADLDDVLREADIAMYHAKRSGKGRVERYTTDLETNADDAAQLSRDVLNAVRRDELVLDYQPLVDLTTGAPVGFEALVRWQHPTRGLLPPGAFIPAAESTGAIVDIGEAVLRNAGRQLRTWQQTHHRPDLYLSVNASACQVERPDFVTRIRRALDDADLAPTALVIEVTESVLINPNGIAAENLLDLQSIGVRVAVDDFGTGYSSLGYLDRLPVDILKIDRTFVSGTGGGAPNLTILDGIVTLGKRLRLEVIPEGIEDPGQLRFLRTLGCHVGQGFLLGRPMRATEADEVLQTTFSPHERDLATA